MEERYFIARAIRTLFCAVVLEFAVVASSGHAQEDLPPVPPQSNAENRSDRDSEREEYCPPLAHRPLTSLTVDIRPHHDGELVAEDDTPRGCSPGPGPAVPFFLDYGSPYAWSCHDLLQLARFCHPRLYFEDVRVERYGYEPCFLGLHSASEFTCDLFFFPARLLKYKDRPCVRTPTPHCMLGCACGF